ncbi:MAG: hypothetical protein FJ102_19865 [Deltaproteobacteria bacterium]|nr:hypothetical protein [Deltaproteobacteria bacterium]
MDSGRERATYAGAFGVLLLAVAAVALAPSLAGNTSVGAWAQRGPTVAAVSGVLGVGLCVFAVTVWLVSAPQVNWQPWVAALARLAAEHGQVMQEDLERGIWFDAVHGGPRFTVLVQPRKGGNVLLMSQRRARHGVLVLRDDLAPGEEFAGWSEVGGGQGWRLYAEVALASRPMLDDRRTAAALDRFFQQAGALSVEFGTDGLTLSLGLPSPDLAARAVREAIDVARQVWEATGADAARR